LNGRNLLIRDAGLLDGRRVDVRVVGERIISVLPRDFDAVDIEIPAAGGLLIPGLHDHHVHIAATAAAAASIVCGPPTVTDGDALAHALAGAPGRGWVRGICYHESVAGMIDRVWLDRAVADRPVRVQHRSGRMWVFNTAALELLLSAAVPPPELERGSEGWTGRLFDADGWLRQAFRSRPPDLSRASKQWAHWGVSGLTDMNPRNDAAAAAHFIDERASGALLQTVLLAGLPELNQVPLGTGVTLGPVKIHLHEAHLPGLDELVSIFRDAHAQGRSVAVHCVTESELVLTIAALQSDGLAGDRIEHASVAPDWVIADIARLEAFVVVQPNFVSERGDSYLSEVAREDWPNLYRLKSFLSAGIVLAGGTDTPFGAADPWKAMAGAVTRRTASGQAFARDEALTPEEALALFLADPHDLRRMRKVEAQTTADLCLLTQNWRELRRDLSAAQVRTTIMRGEIVYDTSVQASELERRR